MKIKEGSKDRFIEIKQRLLHFAQNSKDLLAVIAIGSSVRAYAVADVYSDLDLILVCRNPADWLYGDLPEKLGDIKISFVEPTLAGGMERRILYSGSLDVDLIVLTSEQMELAVTSGVAAEVMGRGYCVLYDTVEIKDKLMQNITEPAQCNEMTQQVFCNTVNDFWFHAVWSAKKLCRGELWTAKMCIDAYMKGLLLKMIEASEEDHKDVWHNGRFLEKWASEDTVAALGNSFAHYDREEMIAALYNTAKLFSVLSQRVAQNYGFTYSDGAEKYANLLLKEYLGEELGFVEVDK